MNNVEFVEAIKRVVRDSAIEGTVRLYTNPPGRAPEQDLVEMSKWYHSLSDSDKAMVHRVVRDSVNMAIFGFLSVLSGVRPIETKPPERGELKLYWDNGTEQTLINDFDQQFLHELYW